MEVPAAGAVPGRESQVDEIVVAVLGDLANRLAVERPHTGSVEDHLARQPHATAQ